MSHQSLTECDSCCSRRCSKQRRRLQERLQRSAAPPPPLRLQLPLRVRCRQLCLLRPQRRAPAAVVRRKRLAHQQAQAQVLAVPVAAWMWHLWRALWREQ